MPSKPHAALALALALAVPFHATATDLSDEGDAPSDPDEIVLDVEARSAVGIARIPAPSKDKDAQLEAAVDTTFVVGSEFGDTKVSSTSSRLTFNAGTPLSRVVAVGFQARFRAIATHFDGDGQFLLAGRPNAEPFDDLLEPSIAIGTRIKLIDRLDVEIAGRAISRIEAGARFADGLEGGGSVSMLWQYRDWMVLRLGVGASSRFDDSQVHVSPVFRLRVRLHERLWAETSGRSGRLQFTASDRVRIDLFGGVEGSRFRLKDRRDGPNGVGDGSLGIRQKDVGLGIRINVLKGLRLFVEAGAVLSQTLEISDEDGDSFDERETREPAFRGRVALRWRF